MHILNNKTILKSYIGNKQIKREYLNNEVVYGHPDFASYYQIDKFNNYTIVGSPTITDGVVSGFSSSNYLKTTEAFNPVSDLFEIVIDFTTGSTIQQRERLFNSCPENSNKGILIYLYNTKFAFAISSDGTSFTIDKYNGGPALSANTRYIVKLVRNATAYELSYSTDGNTFTNIYTQNSNQTITSTIAETLIGCEQNGTYPFGGSINLNNTYIKLSGQMWFNGNPNYGELVWCNPNVYIKNDGSKNWVDTGFTAENNGYSYEADIKFVGTTRQLMGFGGSSREYWGYANSTQFEMGRADYITVTSANHRVKAKFEWSYTGTSSSYTVTETLNINDQSATSTVINANMTSVINNKKHYFIFIMNGYTGYYCNAKLYSHKIYDNSNNLVQHLVPVPKGLIIGSYTVPENGMFDITTQTFFANAGTGTFSYGIDL